MQKQIKNKHIYIYIYYVTKDKHFKAHKHTLISNIVLIKNIYNFREKNINKNK